MLRVVPIDTTKELLNFVKFNNKLYKGNPYSVPSLLADDLHTLSRHNPAMDFCDFQCFLCYKDDQIVGRIAAIINHRANKTWRTNHGRFGFIDFIEDFEVAKTLIDTAEAWLKERGMVAIEGPMGFTDMDKQGLLIEGFDQLSTIITMYNHPYYQDYLNRMNFEKAVDWIELKIFVPEVLPQRIVKIANIVESRSDIRVLRLKSVKQLVKDGWGIKLFKLINIAYAPLYGFSQLTEHQMDLYIKQYAPLLRLDLLTFLVDKDDNLVALGIVLPSLSRTMQKVGGRLFPFGIIHLYRTLKSKKCKVVDFMLIAIHPDWQGKGLNALIMKEFFGNFKKCKTIYAESNPELEENVKVQEQWDDFETEHHKRRRVFIRKIS